jgi:hypothetical protein
MERIGSTDTPIALILGRVSGRMSPMCGRDYSPQSGSAMRHAAGRVGWPTVAAIAAW